MHVFKRGGEITLEDPHKTAFLITQICDNLRGKRLRFNEFYVILILPLIFLKFKVF